MLKHHGASYSRSKPSARRRRLPAALPDPLCVGVFQSAGTLRPPVLSEYKPKALYELMNRCVTKVARACLRWNIPIQSGLCAVTTAAEPVSGLQVNMMIREAICVLINDAIKYIILRKPSASYLATSLPSCTSSVMVSPIPTSPERIFRAARVSTFFCRNRFSGRAP